MISAVKIAAIKAADWASELHDPFEEFTRPARPKYAESLHAKAARFAGDLAAFYARGGTVVRGHLPTDLSESDTGDQALWHGVATAAQAFKARVTGDLEDYMQLQAFVEGLANQQPGGILARGVHENGAMEWDASNDQATGHLLGLYMAWAYGSMSSRETAAKLLDQWAFGVMTRGDALTNPDGRPTTYGALVQGWKTDPLRLSLCMAIYRCAHVVTADSRYLVHYNRLVNEYGDLYMYPKVRLLWWDTAYDTHRAAIHLALMRGVDTTAGLERIQTMTRKQGNVWVDALCMYTGGYRLGSRLQALKVLSEFTVEDKRYNTGRVNSTDPAISKTLWDGRWASRQPLPRWQVAAQDFFWQRSMHDMDFRAQGEGADARCSGLDYLAAYWLCRLLGILNQED